MKVNLFALSVSLLLAMRKPGTKSADIEQRDLLISNRRSASDCEAGCGQAGQDRRSRKNSSASSTSSNAAAAQTSGHRQAAACTGVGGSQLRRRVDATQEPGSPLAKRSVYYEYDHYDIKEEYVPVVEAHSSS
jgi:hypothetical protein